MVLTQLISPLVLGNGFEMEDPRCTFCSSLRECFPETQRLANFNTRLFTEARVLLLNVGFTNLVLEALRAVNVLLLQSWRAYIRATQV